ncbi:hypothetical protein BD626DRAFT_499299 [Schizophyllum amplum]|uniref:MYND-type domain-containing protein n=1 Tax=Schizophyllum amplum TaxID=97359 RepID=A0A550CAW8_9AGAR|nr:hypothetical protein BD626DRAFT_499299 [Auriculariopsis ampla]
MPSVEKDHELCVLANKLRDLDVSSRDARNVRNRIKQVLHSHRRSLADLNVDPFALESSHWDLQSLPVSGALMNLEALEEVLVIPDAHFELLLQPILSCVRDLWPSIISWLDFLHPMHHVGTPRMQLAPLETITRLISSLFTLKGSLPDLFADTPRIYRLIFDLWVRFDIYCDMPRMNDTLHACVGRLGYAVLGYAIWTPDKEMDGGATMEMDKRTEDSVALHALLGVVRYRRRFLYRQIVRQSHILLRLSVSGNAVRNDIILQNQLAILGVLSERLLSIPHYPREVVSRLVRIIQELLTVTGGPAIAHTATSALHSMWRTSGDRCSLVWSLRAGVLPAILTLREIEPIRHSANSLGLISLEAMSVDVLRALDSSGRALDIAGGVLGLDEKPLERKIQAEINQNLRDRIALIRSLYKKTCAYRLCTSSVEQARATLRRCSCQTVCYCCKQCQRRDWPTHRRACRENQVIATHGDIAPLDAHFLMLCGRARLRSLAPDILAEISRLPVTAPDVPPCFHVVLDFGVIPPAMPEVSVMGASDTREAMVWVTSFLHLPTRDAAVRAMYIPVRMLAAF